MAGILRKIVENQAQIIANQETIKRNQETIVANQGKLDLILANQDQIKSALCLDDCDDDE